MDEGMHALNRTLNLLLLVSAFSLSLVGLAFVHSAGSYWGTVHYTNALPFIVKQGVYMAIAVLLAFILMHSKLLSNKQFWTFFFYAVLIMLILVKVPGIGAVRNGSQSWIILGPISLQPAEFAKVAVIGKLSSELAHLRTYRNVFRWQHMMIILAPIVLIMLQPDLGSAVILIAAAFTVLFLAGYRIRFFVLIGALGVFALIALIVSAPYRLNRIRSFVDPWHDPLGAGFQSIQSLFAVSPGGILGHGYGESRQKYLYLPEPQNDFIFSIIAEEIGFIGATLIIGLFMVFLITALRLAVQLSSRFAFFIVSGMAMMIFVQTFLNIGVVSGLLPVTGVTLPFISYGGSSLLTTWFATGTILHFTMRKS